MKKGALAEIGCLSLLRIVLPFFIFPLCPLFSALSSARLCSSPVLSVMVCIYLFVLFFSCFLYRNSLLAFSRFRDFIVFSRSSKTPRYFDELVKTSSLV